MDVSSQYELRPEPCKAAVPSPSNPGVRFRCNKSHAPYNGYCADCMRRLAVYTLR